MTLRIILMCVALLCTACQSSPPKQYFALSASATDLTINESAAVNHLVGVGPVNIPEYLFHNKIGYWKTAQQLVLLDNHYWAEPLERGITRVLALDLQAINPQWRVVQFPWPSNQRPHYAMKVDINRLDAFLDHTILEANIDWVDLQTKKVLSNQRIKLRRNSTANAESIAQAISELLQQATRTIQTPSFPRARDSSR